MGHRKREKQTALTSSQGGVCGVIHHSLLDSNWSGKVKMYYLKLRYVVGGNRPNTDMTMYFAKGFTVH